MKKTINALCDCDDFQLISQTLQKELSPTELEHIYFWVDDQSVYRQFNDIKLDQSLTILPYASGSVSQLYRIKYQSHDCVIKVKHHLYQNLTDSLISQQTQKSVK